MTSDPHACCVRTLVYNLSCNIAMHCAAFRSLRSRHLSSPEHPTSRLPGKGVVIAFATEDAWAVSALTPRTLPLRCLSGMPLDIFLSGEPIGTKEIMCLCVWLRRFRVLPGTTLRVRTAKVFNMGEERRRSAFHRASTSGASPGLEDDGEPLLSLVILARCLAGNQLSGPLRE
ncbi:unnamed protein product [Pleuronectes platessa]|uniref:Uncharacterized protein n=1 Tax=Pleuronectes platessa TaxID=8262 RepID=A0A9N7YM77_PLEPL|nr:unnamed protein product [Pleuronectes platessa]